MSILAPVFMSETQSTWDNSAQTKTIIVAPQAGDQLVVIGMSFDTSPTIATPSGGGLVYTLIGSKSASNNCRVYAWAATAIGGAPFTLTATASGNGQWGVSCYVFRDSAGTGAVATVINSTGTVNLTTTTDGSAIVVAADDWDGTPNRGRVWWKVNTASPNERSYYCSDSNWTVYAGYYDDAGAAGVKKTGLNDSAETYTGIAVEVLGIDPSSAFTGWGVPT